MNCLTAPPRNSLVAGRSARQPEYADNPKLSFIKTQLDLGFGFAQSAQNAQARGRQAIGRVALQKARTACEQAGRFITTAGVEPIRPRLAELAELLERLQKVCPRKR